MVWGGFRKDGKKYKILVGVLEEKLIGFFVVVNKGGEGKGGIKDNF